MRLFYVFLGLTALIDEILGRSASNTSSGATDPLRYHLRVFPCRGLCSWLAVAAAPPGSPDGLSGFQASLALVALVSS